MIDLDQIYDSIQQFVEWYEFGPLNARCSLRYRLGLNLEAGEPQWW